MREAALLNVSFLETEISVEVSEIGPSTRQIRFVEDRLNGTRWHAGATVDAFSGVDVQHPLALVNAVNRTNLDTAFVLNANARLSDYVSHALYTHGRATSPRRDHPDEQRLRGPQNVAARLRGVLTCVLDGRDTVQ